MEEDPDLLPTHPHVYVSTACQHDLHNRCRLICKFCATPCLCKCHGPDGPKVLGFRTWTARRRQVSLSATSSTVR